VARPAAETASAAQAAGAASLTEQLTGQPEAEQRRRLLALICVQAAEVLGHASPDEIKPDQGFLDAEFDSLSLEELRVGLEAATGLQFSDSVVFDHPTPAALAEHLRVSLAPPVAGRPAGTRPAPGRAELDRLEAALPTLRADEAALAELITRLSGMLDRLTNGSGARPDGIDALGAKFGSDEEIFDFIDNELGIS
jgi:polyketide synthase 12